VVRSETGRDPLIVETVLHSKTKDRILTRAFLYQKAWSLIRAERDLTFAKLYDDGLLWHGTDASVSSSDDYREPRRMALALYSEGMTIDGLAYRSRHNNREICYAIFDRVKNGELTPGADETRPIRCPRVTSTRKPSVTGWGVEVKVFMDHSPLGLRCQRCAALHPCPSARPGVARARAAGAEGDHPACTSG
jgi:RES domain